MLRLAVLLALIFAHQSVTLAATGTGTVQVFIKESLSIEAESPIVFNAHDTQQLVRCARSATSLRRDDCSIEGQLGRLVINGPQDQAVRVSVTAENSNPSALRFRPRLQSGLAPILNSGRAEIRVGGNLVADRPPIEHEHLNYLVSVNYN